jgi:hypothetical protein
MSRTLQPTNWSHPSLASLGSRRQPARKGPELWIIITKACGVAIVAIACLSGMVFTLGALGAIVSSVSTTASTSTADAAGNRVRVGPMADPFGSGRMGMAPTPTSSPFMSTLLSLILGVAYAVATGYGGYQMFELDQWGWALAGCILILIPVVCFPIWIGIPVGILGLVAILQPSVRAEFVSAP